MRRAPSRRVFRTVLFTDIVGSTELAAQLGDRRWRRTLAAHNSVIRHELGRHHGREVDTAGDGFFAAFENPTDAVRCAAAAIARVHGLGLRIRAGIHTGEVEPAGDKVGGIAVHIGARLLALAGMEEVLVSSTVRELVAGSGHEFEDRGMRELRGIPGEWHVYALVLPELDESVAVATGEDSDEQRAAGTRRNRAVVAGLIGVIALLLAAIAVAAVVLSQAPPLPTGPDTVVAYDVGNSAMVRGWEVGRGPSALALADGVLWVASMDDGTVTRIDLGTGTSLPIGQVGTRPSAVLAAAGRVWVADRYGGQIAVLDARDGSLRERLAVHASALVFAADGVWVADDLADQLHLIGGSTSETMATVDLASPSGPTALASTGAMLWVAAPRADAVVRVDSGSAGPVQVATDVARVDVLAPNGNDLWFASSTTDMVGRLDATSGRVDARVAVCDTPVALAATPEGAWIACATERALWHLDRAGATVDRIQLEGVPTAVAAEGNRVWVALRSN